MKFKTTRLHQSTDGRRYSAILSWLSASLLLGSACGCSTFAYTNIRRVCDKADLVPQPNCKDLVTAPTPNEAGYQGRATLRVSPERGDPNTLFILALSGGGSRSAYLSADVMLALQTVFPDVDLLSQVDAMSSVSGGSMTAAYYAISTNEPGARDSWTAKNVRALMRKNYTVRWFGNWFWPDNIAKFWFTAFNRTDIMARTFSKNLYSNALLRDLKMQDLRSDRPYLILNSTNGTDGQFDESFKFIDEDFSAIGSDVSAYSLSRAVMGTAAFPGVFNYMTLRDWSSTEAKARYVHIFDGGNYDNLGLKSVIKILDQLDTDGTHYKNLVVVLVDAYTDPRGVSATRANTRSLTDYIIDKNFLASSDALLHLNRANILDAFTRRLEKWYENDPTLRQHALFYHLQFSDLERLKDVEDNKLVDRLNGIPTNFTIESDDANDIDTAVARLIVPTNNCLKAIKDLVGPTGKHGLTDPVCTYPPTIH
jgi:NTE family protein